MLALFIMAPGLLAADVSLSNELRDALYHAGGNRGELESGLRRLNGKDTEYLIAHASQYDLVNLTSQQIFENVTYARKVHQALPYLGKKLDDGLWREWVLPHRVLDEDVCLWRKDFYEWLQPVVRGKKSVREAVEVIHTWLMVGDASVAARIRLAGSENRCQTPLQMFKTGGGGCGELSMMFVYLLRAVGIPARHGLMTWHSNTNDQHYYCEYWDSQLRRWVPLDCSDEKPIAEIKTPEEKLKSGIFNSLSFFAHPGFPGVRDIYHTRCLEACLPVTDHLCPIQEMKLEVEAGIAGTGTSTAYVWNLYSCRPVARGAAAGRTGASVLRLADTKKVSRPMVFTVTDGKSLYWALQELTPQTGSVGLKKAVLGECLRWTDYGPP